MKSTKGWQRLGEKKDVKIVDSGISSHCFNQLEQPYLLALCIKLSNKVSFGNDSCVVKEIELETDDLEECQVIRSWPQGPGSEWDCALVCSGCCHKEPQTEGLQQ